MAELQPSLQELEDRVEPIVPTPPAPAAPVEGLNEDGTVKEGYEKLEDGTVRKIEEAPEETEGLNPDGTLKEGYEKLEDGTIVKKEETPEDFWADVNKITGDPVEVDFGELDPLSPEAVALRDKEISKRAVERFEEYLRNTDPRGYAYILHRQVGGTDEEFFQQTNATLPPFEDFKESVDLQVKFYRQALVSKGIPEKQVNMIVDDAVKNKEIFELAEKEYKQQQADEKAALEELDRQMADYQKEYEKQVGKVTGMINAKIASKELSVVIPEAERPVFSQFVKDRMMYQDGKFYVVEEIDETKVKNLLEAMYLLHRKGNLAEIVKTEALKQNVTKLRRRVQTPEGPKSKNPPAPPMSKPLSEI